MGGEAKRVRQMERGRECLSVPVIQFWSLLLPDSSPSIGSGLGLKNSLGLSNTDRPTAMYYSLYFFALCRGRLPGHSENLPTPPTASPTLPSTQTDTQTEGKQTCLNMVTLPTPYTSHTHTHYIEHDLYLFPLTKPFCKNESINQMTTKKSNMGLNVVISYMSCSVSSDTSLCALLVCSAVNTDGCTDLISHTHTQWFRERDEDRPREKCKG